MARLRRRLFLCAAVTLAGVPSSAAHAGELLQLTPGALSIVRPARPVKTVAIGKPDVADATVESPNTIIITGKAPGFTSMILLDEAGSEISQIAIQVDAGLRKLRVLMGGAKMREYVCDKSCTPSQAEDRLVETAATITSKRADVDRQEPVPAGKDSGQVGTAP